MRTRILLAAPFLAISSSFALDMKGLKPDMPIDSAKAVIASDEWMSKCRSGMANDPRWSCYYSPKYVPRLMPQVQLLDSFAGRAVESWLLIHDGNRIDSITVNMTNKDFDHVAAALMEKWGKPSKSESSEIQNRMGAKFDQIQMTWAEGDQRLIVKKRAGKIDTMSVTLASGRAIRDFEDQRKEQAKDAAKDL